MRALVLHMCAAVALFTWVLGMHTQVLISVWQELTPEQFIWEPHTFVFRWVSKLFVEHHPLGL